MNAIHPISAADRGSMSTATDSILPIFREWQKGRAAGDVDGPLDLEVRMDKIPATTIAEARAKLAVAEWWDERDGLDDLEARLALDAAKTLSRLFPSMPPRKIDFDLEGPIVQLNGAVCALWDLAMERASALNGIEDPDRRRALLYLIGEIFDHQRTIYLAFYGDDPADAAVGLKGGVADPIVALFAERNSIYATMCDAYDAVPDSPAEAHDAAWAKASALQAKMEAIQDQIISTPAVSPLGAAVKLWMSLDWVDALGEEAPRDHGEAAGLAAFHDWCRLFGLELLGEIQIVGGGHRLVGSDKGEAV